MQELIDKLKSKFNLSDEQVNGVLETVASFVKEKFPMAAGVMDNILPGAKTSSEPGTDTDVAQAVTGGAAPSSDMLGGLVDKAKGFL